MLYNYSKLTNGQIPIDFYSFYKTLYPHRPKSYLNFIFSTPYAVFPICIVGYSNGELHADICSIAGKLHYKGETESCIFGCDYNVDKKERNSPLGAAILKKILKDSTHFALGPEINGVSYKMHIIYKERHFANCDVYLRPNMYSIYTLGKFLVKGITNKYYSLHGSSPVDSNYQLRSSIFNLIKDTSEFSNAIEYEKKWMKNEVLEFDRSLAFLQWRYFKAPHHYFFYEVRDIKNCLQGYAVYRAVKFRWFMPAWTLVDCRWKSTDVLEDILKFTIITGRKSRLPFTIVSNSIKSHNKIFTKDFKKIYSFPALSNYKKIDEVEEAMISLADSDLELNKM